MSFQVFSATDPGVQRDRNEDAVLAGSFDDGSWVIIVCDGMGGHDAGDVASKIAARRIYQEVNARLDDPDVAGVLGDALHAAHAEVLQEAEERDSDMGTTAVVARLIGDQLWFGWVGDSRLYLCRNGALELASVDHTVIQAEIDAGRLDPDVDHNDHPDAHALTQALGGRGLELAPTTTHSGIQLQPGDQIVLCSDGLHDLMSPLETVQFIRSLAPEQVPQALIDEANRRGGHDNITIGFALFGVEEVTTQGGAPTPVEPTPVEAPERGSTGPRVTQPDTPLGPGTPTTASRPSPASSPQPGFPWHWLVLLLGVLGLGAAAFVGLWWVLR